jgi:hypothetical protein
MIFRLVGPGGDGDELDERVAVAERRVVIAHRADRATVALEATGRQDGRVDVIAAGRTPRDTKASIASSSNPRR